MDDFITLILVSVIGAIVIVAASVLIAHLIKILKEL